MGTFTDVASDLAAASDYLQSVGIEVPDVAPDESWAFAQRVSRALEEPPSVPVIASALLALYRYPVPKTSADGSCSLEHGLEDQPYDLRIGTELESLDHASLVVHPETVRVSRISLLVEALHDATGADWSGIYRRLRIPGSDDALQKVSYRGRPSRALFPLTEEFALHSNNSTAALRRRAIRVDDVEAYVALGHPYYECDPSVRSELCVPVIRAGESIGLIDLESFVPSKFGSPALYATGLAAVALAKPGLLAG